MTEEQRKKTLGLAVGSLVCGCLFLIPFLGFLCSLAAVILGISALVVISKNKDNLKGNGLAITGIILGSIGVIIVPIIAMLAAIAIPNLMLARARANEAAAVASLKTISVASESFYAVQNRYPDWLGELAYDEPPYISDELASGVHQGYKFKILDTGQDSTLLATAVPMAKGATGMRSFCVVEDGLIRADSKGDEISGYDSCGRLESAESSRHRQYK